VLGGLLGYAAAAYSANLHNQGDLCLLATLLVSSALHTPPSLEAIALAEAHHSRVAWALRFARETRRAPGEGPGDPSVYAADLKTLTDDTCHTPDTNVTLDVARAVWAFAEGKRRESRESLDNVLDQAEKGGLFVPRMTYRYEEKAQNLVLALSVGLSFGGGLLASGSDYNLSLGFRSGHEAEGALTAQLAPGDSAEAATDAARYYVATAALASVLHFLEHDEPRAVADARRVVAALSTGLKLGPRRLRLENPARWGSDSRPAIALAAQFAADAHMPLLAEAPRPLPSQMR
jgi:hypothetical protein